MRKKKIMVYTKYNQNLFIVKRIQLGKGMAINYRKARYIIGKNK